MEKDLLNRMLGLYADEEVAGFSKNAADFANPCYILTTTEGNKYALRVLGVQTPANARFETTLQARLAAHGIQTPRYLVLKNGDTVGEVDGNFFTLAPFIEGKRPSTITLALVEDFGATLATLHVALEGVEVETNEVQWLNPTNVELEIEKCDPVYKGPFKEKLKSIALFKTDLPKAVIHADLGLGNVFATHDRIETVFDFETAEYSYRILDIAATYLFFSFDDVFLKEDILGAIIRGYNRHATQKITDEELAHLPEAIQYVAIACGAWSASRGLTESAQKFLNLAV